MRAFFSILILGALCCMGGCDWKKEKNTAPKPPPKPKIHQKIEFKEPEKTVEVKVVPERVRVKECESNDMPLDDFSEADLVAVLVYANWCPFSTEYAPILEAFTRQDAYKFSVLRINAEELPELAERLEVTAIPKTIFFIKGKKVGEFVGSIREDKLSRIMDNLMKDVLSNKEATPEAPALPAEPEQNSGQPRIRSTI